MGYYWGNFLIFSSHFRLEHDLQNIPPGPPHPHQLGAGKQHEAWCDEAAAGDGEEHEEDGLGGHQVVAPHHEGGVVRRVEAGEARGAGAVPGVLAVHQVELRALELQRVHTALVIHIQHRPALTTIKTRSR